MNQSDFGLTFDVTLHGDTPEITGAQVLDFTRAIQEKLVPRLLGCPAVTNRRVLEGLAIMQGVEPADCPGSSGFCGSPISKPLS